jgi:hypothetical protein
MSFAFKPNAPFRRIPLVRYSARTKRENRIQVQLLKDFPQYGAKGEIIEVLPGLMRNKLYPKNGAAYIIPRLNLGPRIPVVKKQARAVVVEEVKKKEEPIVKLVSKSKKIQSIEIDSLLFDVPETNDEGIVKSAVEEEPEYSLFKLEVNLDLIQLRKGSVAEITKDLIVKQIAQSVSVTVPVEDLTILSNGNPLEVIKEVGEYQIKVTKGKSTVTKPLIVSA